MPDHTAEIEGFIRDASTKRGIQAPVSIKVAKSEGGTDEYAKRGTFSTGSSWWPFQLHYGGAGYEHFGNVAGMGNGFTVLTGWQPGDPAAWRDSIRYALNRAKANGWGAWYGAAAVGVARWDGIDRTAFWDANAERWDFESGLPPRRVVYNRDEPAHLQEETYDCSQESLEWALWALGRRPADDWLEQAMQTDGVMNPDVGLTDASGAGLAAFVVRYYGEDGFKANNEAAISWDWIVHEGERADGSGHGYPVLIGGRGWNHWTGVRDYDPDRGVLLLANPSPGWGGVGQTMSQEQFALKGPFSAIRIWHDDLLAPEPAPPPPTGDTRLPRARAKLEEAISILDEEPPS